MRFSLRTTLLGLGVFSILCLGMAQTAISAEMWVPPAKGAEKATGTWLLTSSGEANFNFALPNDLEAVEGAWIAVLGKKNRSISFDVSASVSQDGAAHNASTDAASGLTAAVSTNELSELDISDLLVNLAPPPTPDSRNRLREPADGLRQPG